MILKLFQSDDLYFFSDFQFFGTKMYQFICCFSQHLICCFSQQLRFVFCNTKLFKNTFSSNKQRWGVKVELAGVACFREESELENFNGWSRKKFHRLVRFFFKFQIISIKFLNYSYQWISAFLFMKFTISRIVFIISSYLKYLPVFLFVDFKFK